MNPHDCNERAELLVDYVDGILTPEESADVETHLESCSTCRQAVADLDESISMTRTLWDDARSDLPDIRVPAGRRRSALPLRWAGLVAACLMMATTIGFVRHAMTDRDPTPKPETTSASFEEIEHRIELAGRTARLTAAVEVLVELPGGAEVVRTYFKDVVGATSRDSKSDRAVQ